MIVTYSGIGITNAKGKIGGNVLSGNVGGRMASIFRKPHYTRSATQQIARNRFQTVVARWPELTEGQRDSWNTEAATGDWDTVNSIGVTIRPTGQQLFIRLNLSLTPIETNISTAPTKPILTTPLLISATATSPNILTVTFNSGSMMGSGYMLIFATLNMSAGVFSPRHSEFLYIQQFPSGGFFSTNSISSAYLARFQRMQVGCSIFIRAELLDGDTGDRITAGMVKCIVG